MVAQASPDAFRIAARPVQIQMAHDRAAETLSERYDKKRFAGLVGNL